MTKIAASALKALMASDEPHALFDIREIGEAEAGQILGATFLPRRMIEFRIADLVPRRDTFIVVYDEGGPRAELAAQRLRQLGYPRVAVLDGGTQAWTAAGHALIEGSNVPSKLFGERVHDHDHTPSVSATTLRDWQTRKAPFLVCDIRTPEEYARSRIPGAYSTAGFDVGLCMPDLKDRSVPIVVNCAGRTRSIIACETLRQLGMEQVYALENGTMGWVLADLTLEKGAGAGAIAPTAAARLAANGSAKSLAQSAGVGWIDPTGVKAVLASRDHGEINAYFFDVRQTKEYDAGHIEGTTILPGALAVQRTDEFMPVRQAQVVLVDDDETRALIAGYWLRRSGYPNVAVLKHGLKAWSDAGLPLTRGRSRQPPLGFDEASAQAKQISPSALRAMLRDGSCIVINVDTSRQFVQRRIAGSAWLPRGWLEQQIRDLAPDMAKTVVVTCRDGKQSVFAAATLAALGYRDVRVLSGGLAAAEELPLEEGENATTSEAKDFILPPYAKGVAGMRRYLEWETRLTRS